MVLPYSIGCPVISLDGVTEAGLNCAHFPIYTHSDVIDYISKIQPYLHVPFALILADPTG